MGVFARIVREPWTGSEVHTAANTARQSARLFPSVRHPANLRVMVDFEDGSRRAVVLRDDTGLEQVTAPGQRPRAGADNGQPWTWGADVRMDVIRRLEKQGVTGVKSIGLAPV